MHKKFTRPGLLFSLVLFSGSLYAQSPGGISRHSLWLKGNFFADSTHTPTLNFNPATMLDHASPEVKFPGTIDDLRKSTIFTVFHSPDVSQDKPVWQLSDGKGDLKLSSRQVSSKSQKTNMAFADSLAEYFKSGPHSFVSTYIRRERAQDDPSADNKDVRIQFGQSKSAPQTDRPQGLIAEFIVYETILKEKDISRIETYLGLKYGITLQRNYLNSSGQTIWSRKDAQSYSNDIAGIGRDDQSTLYQKQGTSSSGSDQLVIGVNHIAPLNSDNTGKMADKDFLIWGDNALPFLLDRNAKPREGDVLLSEKKWLMKSSGRSANTISTQLTINAKTLLSSEIANQNLYLVIDRSGTGNFDLRDCSYYQPDQITDDGMASFSGIQWDTDGSGKDIFTFGVNRDVPLNATDDANKILSFRVYPNPITNGNYSVAVTMDKPAEVTMQIYDAHLRLVNTQKMAGQSDYLFSGHMNVPAGVYIVRLRSTGSVYSKILILQ